MDNDFVDIVTEDSVVVLIVLVDIEQACMEHALVQLASALHLHREVLYSPVWGYLVM